MFVKGLPHTCLAAQVSHLRGNSPRPGARHGWMALRTRLYPAGQQLYVRRPAGSGTGGETRPGLYTGSAGGLGLIGYGLLAAIVLLVACSLLARLL